MLLRPMTASDEITGTWTAVPGYFCEVTSRGQARSVDRVLGNGRRVKGSPLSVTLSNRGYVLVKVYDHDGVRQTRTMHSLMMAAFEPGRPPGTEIRHWNDIGDDNRWAPGGEAACRAGSGTWCTGRRSRTGRTGCGTSLRRWSRIVAGPAAPLITLRHGCGGGHGESQGRARGKPAQKKERYARFPA